MPRRGADVSTLTCPQTVRERDAADELKVKLGIDSDANLVRTALAALAARVEVNIDTELWRLRAERYRRVLLTGTQKRRSA